MMRMSDTNVGLGMVPHKARCGCDECEIYRLQTRLAAERQRARLPEELVAKCTALTEEFSQRSGDVARFVALLRDILAAVGQGGRSDDTN